MSKARKLENEIDPFHCLFLSEILNQDEGKTKKEEAAHEGEDSRVNEMTPKIHQEIHAKDAKDAMYDQKGGNY